MNYRLFKTINHQLGQDLIGKDAFRGVTLSYSWLANQFGHFALGFIPSAACYSLMKRITHDREIFFWSYVPTLFVWLSWAGFELFNFVSTIIRKKKNNRIEQKAKESFYDPRKWHFRKDLFADLGFFALGAVAARFLFYPDMYCILVCLFLCLFLAYEFVYWYPAKIYLQRALYPFQYRLSQWNTSMSDENKDAINQFMHSRFCAVHLLVLGENNDEKTHLGTGIGAEVSYQLKQCRYLTAMKAFECFYSDDPKTDKFSWNWNEADLLIIDDINPSHADIEDVITPEQFLKKITQRNGERNKKCLREKKVIWILGNETKERTVQPAWENMLAEIGVDRTNIITVNISLNKPPSP